MSSKTKTILAICAFALFIVGSVFLYNYLKDTASPPPSLITTPTATTAAAESVSDVQIENSQGAVQTEEKDDTRTAAPDFTVFDTDGNELKLSDMFGKPIVLNFWASWCPPCKSEMPHFDALYSEVGDQITFMMIDLVDGSRETVETGLAYITGENFTFPVFFDTNGEAGYTYGIRSIPTTYFIDKDGYIIAGVQGAIDEETLRTGIEMIR